MFRVLYTTTTLAVRLAVLCLLLTPLCLVRAQYARYPKISGDVQPLRADRMPKWLTFDASMRVRPEYQSAINLHTDDRPLYALTRARLGVSIDPAPWISFYVQAQDSHALALSLADTASSMRDTFDVRQALVTIKRRKHFLLAGRQPLRFADERLIGISDWTNVSRTFDAVLFETEGRNRLSLFTSSVVNIYPGRPDRSDGGLHLHGAVYAWDSLLPKTSVEPFLFVKTQQGVASPIEAKGSELEFTFGSFIAGDLPNGFFYSGTGALQRGGYAGQSIEAGGAVVRVGYTAKKLPLAPETSVEYDRATGGDPSRVGRRSTFDQLYPSDHNVFGLVDLFGWQNIEQWRVGSTILPAKGLSVSVQAEDLHLANSRDAVYSTSGSALAIAPALGFRSSDLGKELDLSAKYITHDLVANAGIGHFFPGQVMLEAGKSSPLTLIYLSFTYRFKVEHEARHPASAGWHRNHHMASQETDD